MNHLGSQKVEVTNKKHALVLFQKLFPPKDLKDKYQKIRVSSSLDNWITSSFQFSSLQLLRFPIFSLIVSLLWWEKKLLISLTHGLFETGRPGLNTPSWNRKTGKVPHQKTKLSYPGQKLEHTMAVTVNLAFKPDFHNLSNMTWWNMEATESSLLGML